MNAQKLYYFDSYRTDFEANIIEVISYENQFAVLLDNTYFYPESGGQPSDIGFINDAEISHVIEADNKTLHITKSKPELGPAVCHIDFANRFDNMQQHSGQHILSACFYKLWKGETSSFHISKDSSTIEIDIQSFDAAMAEELEKMVNSYIYMNLPITAELVDKEKLRSLPLRKQPQVNSDIRIISILDCDCTPCGGTHVKNTGEIGIIKIKRWDKLKGSYKFEFVCGERALQDYIRKNELVNKLSTHFSSPDTEVENAFVRFTEDYKGLQKQISGLREELVGYHVQELLQQATQIGELKVVSKVFYNKDFNDVKLMAQAIAAMPSHIALLASSNAAHQLVFACAADVPINMNNLLKSTLPTINGKGGGSARSAQGGGTGDITAALHIALETLKV